MKIFMANRVTMDIINPTNNSVPQTHSNRVVSDIHSSLTLNFSSHLFFIVVAVFSKFKELVLIDNSSSQNI
jgi:hypothetical protein